MENISGLKIHIGPLTNTRWVALTSVSPYFCFEAESREALLSKLKRLVAFCGTFATELEERKERERAVQSFRATETILARELEDA
jgi:hypothetical protein